MRETPAGRDRRDIVVPGDMRGGRAAPRRAKPAPAAHGVPDSAKAFARAAGTWCLRHPGGALGSLAACGAAIYVCLNAVGFQDGRHPAPILPTVEAKDTAKAAAPKAPDAKVAEAKPAPVRPAPAREVRAEAPPRDAIADMIRSGETTASVTPKPSAKVDASKVDPLKPDPAVARAQRALVKLGYGPLKDDGLMGPGTKAAIERFERDRKLPVKGEAAGRTLRELTTAKAGAAQG
ncbi:peptidoglycan-binding domain-containing protein [Methylorubrum sp. SB2]|uniref:peptidoglycan-binding domain-containing protein n=1 Tax=Methylorubrum subtropicum TaxID=3138812 RepID=UPI00313F0871